MKLLDLFCGAGGAAVGYRRAGFDDIVGVDNRPMPRYPFEFVQADALEYLAEHGHEFDLIHASPPCQGYSIMHNLPWLRDRVYPLLILPTLEMLGRIGRPFVLENVMGARHGAKGLAKRGLEAHGLEAGWLCGAAFGLPFYRHRLFATDWPWMAPGHPKHRHRIRAGAGIAGRAREIVFSGVVGAPPLPAGNFDRWRASGDPMAALMGKMGSLGKWQIGARTGKGHAGGWHLAAAAMGIDWMSRDELTQAIPPAYTEFLGRQFLGLPARLRLIPTPDY